MHLTPDPLVGQVLDDYEILEVLGRGAMGVVYKARQRTIDRVVAVKTIRPEFVTDGKHLERFQREAKAVGRFNTPHVVQVYAVGFAHGLHLLVMEFVGGGDLNGYTQGRPLSVADAVKFMRHAAEALLESERLKILHRDIKPANLLLDDAGRLKLADFGIAKMLGAAGDLTATMGLVGTPLYLSPEQCRGEELSHKSDMYQLGATFYHLLTTVPPCKGESVFELIQTKTSIDCLSPRRDPADGSVPEVLSHVIERLTALDPKDRYESFSDVLEDLRRICVDSGEAAPGHRTRPPLGTARRGSRVPMLALAAGVVLAAGAAVGFYFHLGGPGRTERMLNRNDTSSGAQPR